MAKAYCTGPVHLWVGIAGGHGPRYLGTGESAPDIEIKAEFEPLTADLAGGKVPFDRMFLGEEGLVSCVLTRWNWSVLRKMMARPSADTGTPGHNVSGDVGTVMGLEGKTYPLWCQFPYQEKAFQADMPGGVHFLSAFLLSPDKIKGGAVAKRVHVVFLCQRLKLGDTDYVKTGTELALFQRTTFTLYDYDMSAIQGRDFD